MIVINKLLKFYKVLFEYVKMFWCKKRRNKFLCIFVFIPLALIFFPFVGAYLILFGLFLPVIIKITHIYFHTEKFKSLKSEIINYIKDCNDLNEHIEQLKETDIISNQRDYGIADIEDTSIYNYQRAEFDNFSDSDHVVDCSLSVCKGAKVKPFYYICKYFNVEATEETLEFYEEMLNNFLAVEEGIKSLENKKDDILQQIKHRVPLIISELSEDRLAKELGFEEIDLSEMYFPSYTLQYISDGGNSSLTTEVILNIENLERFTKYLSDQIKWESSKKYQRALMTQALREKIKERDNYTCCHCGNSIYQEPNLLLEIDHITPIAKGGKTEEINLQTLCWKCNRNKGSKIVDNA